jgi:DNA-binding response OmpR family regulator
MNQPSSHVILIADDQPNIRLPLEYLLRSIPGVKVVSTDDGQKAVELAARLRPTLTMLDVMMPAMDGYTASRKIREQWGEPAGQIWFITARGSSFDHEAAATAGASRVINKPFDPDQILAAVREHLDSLAAPATP